jgi:hypothetical protein
VVAASLSGLVFALVATPAGADPVNAGRAEAFAVTADIAGQDGIPPTPESTVTAIPFGDDADTAVDIPAGPVLVSGTFNSSAAVHSTSDLASELATDGTTQSFEGPYNAKGVALIEGLDVLATGDVTLLSADVIRAEAVGACVAGQVQYSASSEIVNLAVAGQDIPLNTPVTDLIDSITGALVDAGLAPDVVDVQRNVVSELDGGGVAVDALTISAVADAGPLLDVVIGHAEVGGLTCGTPPECSDGVDNGDPEDTLVDATDPGCHSDGDPENPDTYDPTDDDETDLSPGLAPSTVPPTTGATRPATGAPLPRTGAPEATILLTAAALLALTLTARAAARRGWQP